jgi:hypothetical protein
MITESSRFSFYKGITPDPDTHFGNTSFLPSLVASGENGPELEKAWLKEINTWWVAAKYESVFYMKVMEQLCENNNFKLLLTTWDDTFKETVKIYKSKYLLHPHGLEVWAKDFSEHFGIDSKGHLVPQEFVAECGHPNEKGYEMIAQMIFDLIKKHHRNIKLYSPKEKIDWEWLGQDLTHIYNTDITKKII